MGSHSHSPPQDAASPADSGIRKRVCKACDRCRLKKSKCDGASPCSRCRVDNAICVFGERKKSHDKVYPKGYVEMLESQQAQLVAGLQELYRRVQTGSKWPGAPLKESSNGQPLTHDILERLGALKAEGALPGEGFEENLNILQQRLALHINGSLSSDNSMDSNSERDQSPVYDMPAINGPTFSNPFALNNFPPTPPDQSPFPSLARPREGQQKSFNNTSFSHGNIEWDSNMLDLADGMDLVPQYDSTFDSLTFSPTMYQEQISGMAINPVMTMKDWSGQEAQRYYSPNML